MRAVAIPSERTFIMTQRAHDTPEQVLKFVPKEKAQNKVPQVDEAGEAIELKFERRPILRKKTAIAL